MNKTIERAKRMARETGATCYVAEIDEPGDFDDRRIIACDDSYVCSGEFEAFNGRVLLEVGPSGDVY
jgi:hypothetical protein